MKSAVSNLLHSRQFLILFAIAGIIAGYLSTAHFFAGELHSFSGEALSIPRPIYSGPNQSQNDTIEAYRRSPKSAQSRIDMLNALANWIATDPLSCVNNVGGVLVDSHYEGVFGDSEAALAAASKIQDIKTRHRIIRDAFRDVVSRDSMKALDFVRILPASLRYAELRNLGKALGKEGGERVTAALHHENCDQEIFTQALRSWAKENTEEALKVLDGIDASQFAQGLVNKRAIWSELANSGDPEVRLRYIEKMPLSSDREEYMTAAKGSILASTPSKWDSMFQTEDSRLLIGKIASDAAYKTVGSSPAHAFFFLSKIPTAEKKTQAARAVTSRLYDVSHGGKDTAMVEGWLSVATDPIIKDAILAELKFQKVPIPKGYQP